MYPINGGARVHLHSIENWQHGHVFLGEKHDRNERRTWLVVAITAVMMVVEIVGGHVFGSMALVADGWHMSTHATALGIAALAYRFARAHAHDPRFSFGTGKLGELAGYSSAIILAMIALYIGVESVVRLVDPVAISFREALPIAGVGLLVNLASAWLLRDDDHHEVGDDDEHLDNGHAHHHHHDHNFRAAYFHVLADTVTSVLAIAGLLGGLLFGWVWMDPVMGLIGTAVIAAWSWSLIRSSGAVLLDTVPDQALARNVRDRLEVDGDKVADLHLWRLGPGHCAAVVSIVADQPGEPAKYKQRLSGIPTLSHVTVEVHRCLDHTIAGG